VGVHDFFWDRPERAPPAPRQTTLYYDFEIRTWNGDVGGFDGRNNALVACVMEPQTILLVPPATKCALAKKWCQANGVDP
jgi:hypothetical protein